LPCINRRCEPELAGVDAFEGLEQTQSMGASRLEPKSEGRSPWGTTGLPFEPAWVWEYRSLGCVGRGLR
jgi:hypothetical protein